MQGSSFSPISEIISHGFLPCVSIVVASLPPAGNLHSHRPGPALRAGLGYPESRRTAYLNELELGEYCRRKGIYPEQIANWKKDFIQASSPAECEQLQQQARTIKQLQSELNRKDKVLSEAAALLVLGKKFRRSGRSQWTKNLPPRAPKSDHSPSMRE
jgi:hypothetical protein